MRASSTFENYSFLHISNSPPQKSNPQPTQKEKASSDFSEEAFSVWRPQGDSPTSAPASRGLLRRLPSAR